METRAQFEELASSLRDWKTPLRVDLEALKSGLTFLHVGIGSRCFVLAFYPKGNGFGVDEVLEDEGFEMGYKYRFDEFAPAKEKLLSMLTDAL